MATTAVLNPTAIHLPELRLNAVCPYYTMYPLEFPYRELEDANPSDDVVLDPFCGRGTTLFAARLHGLESVGIDLNPVATAIARSKIASTTSGRVMTLFDQLIESQADADLPEGRFWTLAFEAQTLKEMVALRAGLASATDSDTCAVLRAVFLGALHGPKNKGLPSYLSNQMPRSYATKPDAAIRYWEKREMLPERVELRALIERRVKRLLESPVGRATGRVILGDARSALKGTRRTYSRVITSPPYLGMRTYLPDQWLRSWAIGGPELPEYTMENQISSQDPDLFIPELTEVWNAVGLKCRPGARMTVRFGALPSVPVDPLSVIEDSIENSSVGWTIRSHQTAGTPRSGRRQADQFGQGDADPVSEIDVVAVLK